MQALTGAQQLKIDKPQRQEISLQSAFDRASGEGLGNPVASNIPEGKFLGLINEYPDITELVQFLEITTLCSKTKNDGNKETALEKFANWLAGFKGKPEARALRELIEADGLEPNSTQTFLSRLLSRVLEVNPSSSALPSTELITAKAREVLAKTGGPNHEYKEPLRQRLASERLIQSAYDFIATYDQETLNTFIDELNQFKKEGFEFNPLNLSYEENSDPIATIVVPFIKNILKSDNLGAEQIIQIIENNSDLQNFIINSAQEFASSIIQSGARKVNEAIEAERLTKERQAAKASAKIQNEVSKAQSLINRKARQLFERRQIKNLEANKAALASAIDGLSLAAASTLRDERFKKDSQEIHERFLHQVFCELVESEAITKDSANAAINRIIATDEFLDIINVYTAKNNEVKVEARKTPKVLSGTGLLRPFSQIYEAADLFLKHKFAPTGAALLALKISNFGSEGNLVRAYEFAPAYAAAAKKQSTEQDRIMKLILDMLAYLIARVSHLFSGSFKEQVCAAMSNYGAAANLKERIQKDIAVAIDGNHRSIQVPETFNQLQEEINENTRPLIEKINELGNLYETLRTQKDPEVYEKTKSTFLELIGEARSEFIALNFMDRERFRILQLYLFEITKAALPASIKNPALELSIKCGSTLYNYHRISDASKAIELLLTVIKPENWREILEGKITSLAPKN